MTFSNKMFGATLVLVAFLVLSLMQLPLAHSLDLPAPDQALSFLKDVVQLDMSKYNAKLVSHVDIPIDQGGPLGVMVKYTLISAEGEMDAIFCFQDNTLYWCKLYRYGTPFYAQESYDNALDAAKGFMQRYQTYSGASYLPALCDVLDTVNEATPMSVTSGNVKLEYSTSEDSANVVWTYTVNGLDIEYNRVRIDFNDDVFESFRDSWNLYAVGSTDVNVSEEEAKNMAREYAEKFMVDVWPGNLTTLYLRDEPVDAILSMQPRGFTEVYPLWQVQLLFDKVFNGWNGIKVSLWADTAEIIDAKVTGGLGGPSTGTNDTAPTSEGNGTTPDLQPQPNTLLNACIAIGFASVPMIAVAALVLKRRRK